MIKMSSRYHFNLDQSCGYRSWCHAISAFGRNFVAHIASISCANFPWPPWDGIYTCSGITARGGKIAASYCIIFSLFTVFHNASEVLLIYSNFHSQIWSRLRTRISKSRVLVCFLGNRCYNSPRLRLRVVMCQFSCFFQEIQLSALILVRPDCNLVNSSRLKVIFISGPQIHWHVELCKLHRWRFSLWDHGEQDICLFVEQANKFLLKSQRTK